MIRKHHNVETWQGRLGCLGGSLPPVRQARCGLHFVRLGGMGRMRCVAWSLTSDVRIQLVSIFNSTPSLFVGEVWCWATGQKTSSGPVLLRRTNRSRNGFVEKPPDCLYVSSLALLKSSPRRYPSKGGYGCTSALWEPRVTSLDKWHRKCDENISCIKFSTSQHFFMTTELRSLTRACNMQAGQHVSHVSSRPSLRSLSLCQNDMVVRLSFGLESLKLSIL